MGKETDKVINETELKQIIIRCIRNDLNAQELLYRNFYGFAMGICLRFSSSSHDARTIINEGFLKVFRNLHRLDQDRPFLPWLRTIMSNTAIDHYRSELKHMNLLDINETDEIFETPSVEHKLNYEELIQIVQQLPASYRTVFNLYAIDGLSHEEISKQLNITVGGSKSNLFKARKKLQELLRKHFIVANRVVPINSPGHSYLSVIK